MDLSSMFDMVAYKTLQSDEITPDSETRATVECSEVLLGLFDHPPVPTRGYIRWVHLRDNLEEFWDEGRFALECSTSQASSLQWRISYTSEDLWRCDPGDTFLLIRDRCAGPETWLTAIIVESGTNWLRAIEATFPVADAGPEWRVVTHTDLALIPRYPAKHLLNEIDIGSHV